ncbi:MAG TPA: ATP-binding protein [Bryobacteraceae bacterium]|jgi:light-regulated signal transduction histidine kinase (bacteriophytochrome)|nr:ATP-binding protein [Bryobacteraceae bacterium]
MTDLDTSLETEKRLRLEAEDRLRRANADFQEFATRIAHDLREPLRTVSSYCQLLANRFGKTEDEDAALFLRYIHDAVERAQILMAGVVEYSTIEGDRRRPTNVDLNAVVAEAARRAGQDRVHKQGNLPVVVGEYDLLVNVMRHLFDNAVKFAQRPDVSIDVSARREDGDWIISVHDNGPGIDPAHHERVFGFFRRLHGREYPGAGLGLAYCRKAIDLLGGRMWVESKPGEGATFLFSLPAAGED